MTLDAYVYCDCYETGRLLRPPPNPELIFIELDGAIGLNLPDSDIATLPYQAFLEWQSSQPCEHSWGFLLHHHIGNIGHVSLLRHRLRQKVNLFPIIMQKIIYNGIHSGDYLSLETVVMLQNELDVLADFQAKMPEVSDLPYFHQQLTDLVDAALSVQKPITF